MLDEVVPYASDWETAGVPWSFPSAAQALRAGRGDCESRALVLASVLAAKGIPHELRMSFDHLWVEYPGKVPTASESDARALTGTDGDGWSGLRWPDDLRPAARAAYAARDLLGPHAVGTQGTPGRRHRLDRTVERARDDIDPPGREPGESRHRAEEAVLA